MTEPTKRNARRAPGASVETVRQTSPQNTADAPAPQPPFVVVIRGTRRREWGRYATFAEADDQARAMRRHGFDAHVETGEAAEAPL